MNELSMFPAQDIHSMDSMPMLKDIGELHVYTHWSNCIYSSASTLRDETGAVQVADR